MKEQEIQRWTAKRRKEVVLELLRGLPVVSFPCGEDGLAYLAVVMDNFNREVLGYEFALRGRVQEAVRALEESLLGRFGSLFVDVDGLVLRSDNGLMFQSKAFRAACQVQGVKQVVRPVRFKG